MSQNNFQTVTEDSYKHAGRFLLFEFNEIKMRLVRSVRPTDLFGIMLSFVSVELQYCTVNSAKNFINVLMYPLCHKHQLL